MAKMPKLTSMEMDDEEKLDAVTPISMPGRADYPYGLKICLSEKEIDKLGLDPEEAEAGRMIQGRFKGCITSVSREDRDGKQTCRVEIQIEYLAIESEDDDNEAAENDDEGKSKRRRSVLYG